MRARPLIRREWSRKTAVGSVGETVWQDQQERLQLGQKRTLQRDQLGETAAEPTGEVAAGSAGETVARTT